MVPQKIGARVSLPAQPKVQKRWLQFISQGKAAALLVTPPCSTFSRAAWANERGPFPLRSSRCLRGFEWNAPRRRAKAELGNNLADFAFEAMRRQLLQQRRPAIMEQPEDLGATRAPSRPSARIYVAVPPPPRIVAISRGAEHSSCPGDFGTPSPKPTRLLLRVDGPLRPEMYTGLPAFDENGFYVGPLPTKEGSSLIGKEDGQFKTAAAAAWPPRLCEWMAKQFLAPFQRNSTTGGSQDLGRQDQDLGSGSGTKRKRGEEERGEEPEDGEKRDVKKKRVDEEEEDVDLFEPPIRGGAGKARGCKWKGQEVPFHDGGCLLSPGWAERAPLRKIVAEKAGGDAKLERECFAMASGERGCRLARDEELKQEVRQAMSEFAGLGSKGFRVSATQPSCLDLTKGMLERAGDGDCQFLGEAKDGFVVGVKYPMPRTPAAFERQVEWALQDDPTGGCALEKRNYPLGSAWSTKRA